MKGIKVKGNAISDTKILKVTGTNVKHLNFSNVITEFKSNHLAFEGMQMINYDDHPSKIDLIKMVNHIITLSTKEKADIMPRHSPFAASDSQRRLIKAKREKEDSNNGSEKRINIKVATNKDVD